MSRHHHAHSTRHGRHYPLQLVRFDGLQGGQSGFLTLTAMSDDTLEVQLGADFVRLTRAKAAELGFGVTAFLALEEDERSERPVRREHRPEPRETVIQEVVEIAEELMTTERSPSSQPPPPQSEQPRRRGRGRSA